MQLTPHFHRIIKKIVKESRTLQEALKRVRKIANNEIIIANNKTIDNYVKLLWKMKLKKNG